jgi:zinc transporter
MPEGVALKKLIGHPPAWLEEHDLKLLKGVAESLAFLIDDAGELHERAKLLQEELASRVAETIGRNLYVLSSWPQCSSP